MADTSYVSQRQDMIRTVEPKARLIGSFIKWYLNQLRNVHHQHIWKYEDFQFFQDPRQLGLKRPPYYIKRGDTEYIRFLFSNDHCVDIGNFRLMPGGGTTDTPPPVVLEEKMTDSQAEPFENTTDRPIKRSREFEDYKVVTTAEEVANALAVKAGLQFRQLISYGSKASPVQGETEITASVETETSKSQTNSHQQEEGKRDTGGFEDEVPPWTIMTFYREFWRTRSRQDATVDGDLDWTTWIWSRDDFDYEFPSKRDLDATLRGVGNTSRGIFDELLARYPAKPLLDAISWIPSFDQYMDDILAPVHAKFTVSHDYDASTRTRYRFEDARVPGHEEDYQRWREASRQSE